MRVEIYAMIVITPISFLEDLQIQVVPLSRDNDAPLGGNFSLLEHHTWDWVRNQYPVREGYVAEVEGYLKAGERANLVRGAAVMEVPDDTEFPVGAEVRRL